MDLRNLTSKAADRIKSVFSKDNRFFYGTPEHQEESYVEDASRAPSQGVYPNTYTQAPYQQPPQQVPYGQQHPGYQQQPQGNPMQGGQPYAPPVQPAPQGYPQPQPQWHQQPYVDPAYQQPQQQPVQQFTSPQQNNQLNQQPQQQDTTGRTRRAAQHAPQQQPDNIVQFPGSAPEQETKTVDAYVVNITNITGCRQAMSCLRKGQCTLVVMDQLVDKAEVRRYVDMLNGACFALGGTMTRLSVKVGFYILAPSGMMVYTDPITASANAPARPQPQAQQAMPQQQPVYQPQPQYQPQPAYQQQPQPAAQAYPQQQNPYAPPAQQQDPGQYYQEPYNAQRYAQ